MASWEYNPTNKKVEKVTYVGGQRVVSERRGATWQEKKGLTEQVKSIEERQGVSEQAAISGKPTEGSIRMGLSGNTPFWQQQVGGKWVNVTVWEGGKPTLKPQAPVVGAVPSYGGATVEIKVPAKIPSPTTTTTPKKPEYIATSALTGKPITEKELAKEQAFIETQEASERQMVQEQSKVSSVQFQGTGGGLGFTGVGGVSSLFRPRVGAGEGRTEFGERREPKNFLEQIQSSLKDISIKFDTGVKTLQGKVYKPEPESFAIFKPPVRAEKPIFMTEEQRQARTDIQKLNLEGPTLKATLKPGRQDIFFSEALQSKALEQLHQAKTPEQTEAAMFVGRAAGAFRVGENLVPLFGATPPGAILGLVTPIRAPEGIGVFEPEAGIVEAITPAEISALRTMKEFQPVPKVKYLTEVDVLKEQLQAQRGVARKQKVSPTFRTEEVWAEPREIKIPKKVQFAVESRTHTISVADQGDVALFDIQRSQVKNVPSWKTTVRPSTTITFEKFTEPVDFASAGISKEKWLPIVDYKVPELPPSISRPTTTGTAWSKTFGLSQQQLTTQQQAWSNIGKVPYEVTGGTMPDASLATLQMTSAGAQLSNIINMLRPGAKGRADIEQVFAPTPGSQPQPAIIQMFEQPAPKQAEVYLPSTELFPKVKEKVTSGLDIQVKPLLGISSGFVRDKEKPRTIIQEKPTQQPTQKATIGAGTIRTGLVTQAPIQFTEPQVQRHVVPTVPTFLIQPLIPSFGGRAGLGDIGGGFIGAPSRGRGVSREFAYLPDLSATLLKITSQTQPTGLFTGRERRPVIAEPLIQRPLIKKKKKSKKKKAEDFANPLGFLKQTKGGKEFAL